MNSDVYNDVFWWLDGYPLTDEELKKGYNYPTLVHYYDPEEPKPIAKPYQEYRPYPEPDWEKYKKLRRKEPVTLPEDVFKMLDDSSDIRYMDIDYFNFWWNYPERFEIYNGFPGDWDKIEQVQQKTVGYNLNKIHKIWDAYESISSQELIPFIEALPEQKFYLSPTTIDIILQANTKADMIFFLLNFGDELNDVISFKRSLRGDYYSTLSLRHPAGSSYILAEDSKELILFPVVH